jgi:hypothetical protein
VLHCVTPPVPSSVQRVPVAPLRLQYLLAGVAHIIEVGHVFVASQLTSQPHEVSQLTLPHAGSSPVHVAVHLLILHVIAPQASVPPLHVSWHFDVVVPVQLIEPQAAEPAQSRVQSPVAHVRLPHTCCPPPPLHVSVHLPAPQLRLPHASEPLHVALQLPVVQPMLPHAFTPVQSTSQFLVVHVMPRHALSAVQ